MYYILSSKKSEKKPVHTLSRSTSGSTAIQFDVTPDLPISFGYKNQWLAVKTIDTQAVVAAMDLKNIQIANWSTGLIGANEGYYFVTPPINGWTLVINSLMPDISGVKATNPLTIIAELSAKFGDACYFGTNRVVEYHAWAKSINGKLIRAYGYLGESGEILINQGEATKEEQEYFEAEEPVLPNEEDVLFLAKQWSIDSWPDHEENQMGTGFVGKLE